MVGVIEVMGGWVWLRGLGLWRRAATKKAGASSRTLHSGSFRRAAARRRFLSGSLLPHASLKNHPADGDSLS